VEKGFNMATWYLGYDGEDLTTAAPAPLWQPGASSSSATERKAVQSSSVARAVSVTSGAPAQQHQALLTSDFAVRDDGNGRRMLALAKRRLSEMDFVGLASRFSESVEVMGWQLGLPLDRFCSCNVNAFKRSADAFSRKSPDKDAAGVKGSRGARGARGTHEGADASSSTDAGGGTGPLSAAAVARILADNSLDLELYAHGVKLYEAQLAAYKRGSTQSTVVAAASPQRGDGAVPLASSLPGGGGFVCDKGRMLCMEKSFLGAGPANYQIKWHPPATFEKRNKRYITRGWHSSCSYMCYREACATTNGTGV
jgi:hypothetical protein